MSCLGGYVDPSSTLIFWLSRSNPRFSFTSQPLSRLKKPVDVQAESKSSLKLSNEILWESEQRFYSNTTVILPDRINLFSIPNKFQSRQNINLAIKIWEEKLQYPPIPQLGSQTKGTKMGGHKNVYLLSETGSMEDPFTCRTFTPVLPKSLP